MCYYAKLKLNQLERCKILELLVLSFWIGYSGIIFSCRLIQRRDLEIIFLSGIVLLASTAFSASSTFDARRCLKPEINPSVFRYKVDVDGDDSPDFESVFGPKGLVTITGKLPWSVIVIYGAASVITRVAETTGLARVAFGTEFWSQLPDFGKQALLTITSSLMAEFMNAAALCHAILPFVTHLSIGTEHGALYYCLPVAVGASLNTIMPVSLPLVMLHEAVPVTRKQLILTGAFVKTFVIASILLSMNTTGEYVLNIPRPLNTTQGLYQFAGH
ncbi:putative transporter B0285.6 [Haemaphysalis longicornis]